MTNLTEKWKKGELTGEYWCEIVESPYPERVYLPTYENDLIVKVLAPAPSYEQWQAKLEENKRLKHDVGNLGYKIKNQRHEIDNRLKEIEKLKKLLDLNNVLNIGSRVIYARLKENTAGEQNKLYVDMFYNIEKMIAKINQVLGEE